MCLCPNSDGEIQWLLELGIPHEWILASRAVFLRYVRRPRATSPSPMCQTKVLMVLVVQVQGSPVRGPQAAP